MCRPKQPHERYLHQGGGVTASRRNREIVLGRSAPDVHYERDDTAAGFPGNPSCPAWGDSLTTR
eukprot:1920283-Pyramimonas_sp.AAC.1